MRIALNFSISITVLIHLSVSAHSQEYSYNAAGSLRSDVNKQIASIHYNYLQLPDTITYTDNRKIIYTYTASGQKLRQANN
jgi:hypothetical protein